MKRWIAGILACLMILVAAGCGKTETKEPEITKMRAICELAVMECYYHNVAKFKEDGGKILFFNKKDTEFWIEYSGIVKLGVDISQVKMEIREEQVTVTLPPAQVLSCRVDSSTLNAEKFIVAQSTVYKGLHRVGI